MLALFRASAGDLEISLRLILSKEPDEIRTLRKHPVVFDVSPRWCNFFFFNYHCDLHFEPNKKQCVTKTFIVCWLVAVPQKHNASFVRHGAAEKRPATRLNSRSRRRGFLSLGESAPKTCSLSD